MSKERSIPKRLSGSEALDSLCHQIRKELSVQRGLSPADLDLLMKAIWERLARHEDFHSLRGYAGYSATVVIISSEIRYGASVALIFRAAMSYGRPPLHDNFFVEMKLPKFSCSIEVPVAPPNQVREECGMDMPVQVEENGVPVEKWVKPAQYKGRLKPNGKKPRVANMGVPTAPGTSPIDADTAEEYGIHASS